jgi:hypothetical protein
MPVVAGLQRRVRSNLDHDRRADLDDRRLLSRPQWVLIWSGHGYRAAAGLSSFPIAIDCASVSFTVRPTTSSSFPRYQPTTSTSGRASEPVTAPTITSTVSLVFHF